MDEKTIRPDYYRAGGIQVFDIVDLYGLDFYLGNVVKYVCRAGKKAGNSKRADLEKAIEYLKNEISRCTNPSPDLERVAPAPCFEEMPGSCRTLADVINEHPQKDGVSIAPPADDCPFYTEEVKDDE